jgi:hypothetical protein
VGARYRFAVVVDLFDGSIVGSRHGMGARFESG